MSSLINVFLEYSISRLICLPRKLFLSQKNVHLENRGFLEKYAHLKNYFSPKMVSLPENISTARIVPFTRIMSPPRIVSLQWMVSLLRNMFIPRIASLQRKMFSLRKCLPKEKCLPREFFLSWKKCLLLLSRNMFPPPRFFECHSSTKIGFLENLINWMSFQGQIVEITMKWPSHDLLWPSRPQFRILSSQKLTQ